MSEKKHIRWQKAIVDEALKSRRVLILAGSRQCGKTTLTQMQRKKNINCPH